MQRKIIAIYARVSTTKQEEEQTVKSQLEACYEYAKKHEYIVGEVYKDEGWSGDILARPSLDQLRQDVKDRKWQAVLIYDPDRLARRYSYQELVMDEFKEAGVEVLFVTMAAPKNNEDKILQGVRGLFAEYERAKITERFRLGKVRKAKEGHIITTHGRYGYTYVPKQGNKQGYYEINEEEAKVIKYIFELAAEGLSIKKIVKRLYEAGIKPRNSKRGIWNASTIGAHLRCKVYIGEAHWGRTYSVLPQKPQKTGEYKKLRKTSRKVRPEDEWYKIPVPPIISKKLFDKVQVQARKNLEMAKRNQKYLYLLKSKVKCVCGTTRAGGCWGKTRYYRCCNRVYNAPLPRTCFEGAINADLVEKMVWEKLASLLTSPRELIKHAMRWKNTKKQRDAGELAKEKEYKKEIAKLEQEEDRYLTAYGEGALTLEKLKQFSSAIRAKIKLLNEQISNITKESDNVDIVLPSKKEILQFNKTAPEELAKLTWEAKRAIIVNTVQAVIGTPTEVTLRACIPYYSDMVLCPDYKLGKDVMFPLSVPIKLENDDKLGKDVMFPLSVPIKLENDDKYSKDTVHSDAIPIEVNIPLPRVKHARNRK